MPTFDLNRPPYCHNVRYWTQQIPPSRDGIEAGTFLHHTLGLSAAQIKRIKYLDDGIVLDGQRITTRCRCKAGQTLRIRLSDSVRSSDLVPVPGPLELLYEDSDLLVLNKAPGLAVHPGMGQGAHTLGNYLLAYYDQKGIPADFHPVHRLDKGTSGVIVVAKHAPAQDFLRQAFHSDALQREYLAVCDGIPEESAGTITYPLAHSETSVIRQEITPNGAPAHTEYRLVRSNESRSLLHLQLKTGRTHQIRVHMAAIGHPLTGDFLYGTENPALISRPALHSYRLTFRHPFSGEAMTFIAPLPADMAALLGDAPPRQ